MKIMLETEDEDNPSTNTLVDNIVLFTQSAIRNSTVNGDLDFGISLRNIKEERVVIIENSEKVTF